MKFTQSSANPEKVALTIRGAAIFVVPVTIMIGRHYGFSWTETQVVEAIEQLSIVVATSITLVGLGRKLYHYCKELLEK